MNKKYKDILNKLISSYYNDNFDKEVEKILKSNDFSNETLNILFHLYVEYLCLKEITLFIT